jgi:hypothetical protein
VFSFEWLPDRSDGPEPGKPSPPSALEELGKRLNQEEGLAGRWQNPPKRRDKKRTYGLPTCRNECYTDETF